jgi:tetratricopeptide (TPR) repeat protein
MKIPDSLPPDSRLLGLAPDAIRAVVAAAHTLDLGRVDEAERQIRALLAPYPDHPEVLRLLAGLQSLRGDATAALNTMHRAVSARPNDALYLNTVGTIQLNAGDYDGAIATLRHACGIDPNMAVAWYNLGLALVRSVRPIEAATALRRALALSPDKFNARVMLADMLKAANQIGAAQTEYRRVLAQKSDAGMAWWGLADIKTLKLDETDVAAIELALRKPDASDDDVIAMGFALAKALDDQGRYAQSLDALAAANARARARRHWNAAQFSDGIDKVLSIFTPPPAGAPQALGQEVIFIASLPRSGSTLIEQILASHSQIEGAGELPDLPLVLSEESQRRRQFFPHWVPSMQPEDWARLGRRYLERTAHWRAQRPRFTDKLPSNWMYVGAIRAMLPGARIVIGRRDPLETCLSCYRQHLANNEYTRDFDDLAAHWRDFDRSARHWRQLHPTRVFENHLEAVVADPEIRIRELLAFCDLPFEPACVEFHKTERDVHTPSAAQVREPLRGDTARAERYGALLDPLRAALGLAPFSATPSLRPER